VGEEEAGVGWGGEEEFAGVESLGVESLGVESLGVGMGRGVVVWWMLSVAKAWYRGRWRELM